MLSATAFPKATWSVRKVIGHCYLFHIHKTQHNAETKTTRVQTKTTGQKDNLSILLVVESALCVAHTCTKNRDSSFPATTKFYTYGTGLHDGY